MRHWCATSRAALCQQCWDSAQQQQDLLACMHHLLIQQTAAETLPLWHDLTAHAHIGSGVQVQLEGSCKVLLLGPLSSRRVLCRMSK